MFDAGPLEDRPSDPIEVEPDPGGQQGEADDAPAIEGVDELVVEMPTEPIYVDGDLSRLSQVFSVASFSGVYAVMSMGMTMARKPTVLSAPQAR